MTHAVTISFKLDDPIFSICRTTYERRVLIEELRSIDKYMYSDKKVDMKKIIKLYSRESAYEIINRVVGSDPAYFHERIKTITTALHTLPECELTLSIEPSVSLIERIWLKITETTKQPMILKFHYLPWIIGGAMIAYGGKYGDYGLGGKIEKMI